VTLLLFGTEDGRLGYNTTQQQLISNPSLSGNSNQYSCPADTQTDKQLRACGFGSLVGGSSIALLRSAAALAWLGEGGPRWAELGSGWLAGWVAVVAVLAEVGDFVFDDGVFLAWPSRGFSMFLVYQYALTGESPLLLQKKEESGLGVCRHNEFEIRDLIKIGVPAYSILVCFGSLPQGRSILGQYAKAYELVHQPSTAVYTREYVRIHATNTSQQ
jgi:hypothetical protein